MAWESGEPKVGEWVIVAHREEGDVTVLRVASRKWIAVSDGGAEVFALSDGSAWAVETGLPLSRHWKDHDIRPADEGTLCNRSVEALARIIEQVRGGDMPSAVLAKLYGQLLTLVRE